MSDDEIRGLLDLAADEAGAAEPMPSDARDLWTAGRRQRARSRAYVGGLGAAAAAAGIVGLVWGQGLLGGQETPFPPANSTTDVAPGPVDDRSAADETGEATGPEENTGAEEPIPDGEPMVVGSPAVMVFTEGDWAPTGALQPLTAQEATDRHWLPVATDRVPPAVGGDPSGELGLSTTGTTWRIRDCGVDVTVEGAVQDGVLNTSGEPVVVPDPDPEMSCPGPLGGLEWAQLLTNQPRLSTDGQILVITGGTDQTRLEPVGLGLVPDGLTDPAGGPTGPVDTETLAAGLTEVTAQTATDLNITDLHDAQPEHQTTLSVADGVASVDVGCADPLTGPAWYSPSQADSTSWTLTAALSAMPDCTGASAQDAEQWRQMLAHGLVLHRFGDFVVVDSWADPSLAP